MTYNGAPWRSRFLRGPKIGLELAQRPDFVELGHPDVAQIRLGLKSGADKFFFVNQSGSPVGSRIPVVGLNGWEGSIARADLAPSLQSPKDLDTPSGRLATVPTRFGRYSGTSFYFAPRANRLDRVAREYIAWGEQQKVQDGKLVQSNADPSGWFRQTRAQVRSRWALPYNSGYDYGAIDNSVESLLNGRFIGVEPADGLDPDLLGGILNCTAVTLMRLLEGVATGNEGAFDVGPPAARVMRIPDPRRIGSDSQGITEVLDEIRAGGVLPPAPSSLGVVVPLRRRLDLAVFCGLGMSRGDSTVLIDRVYSSYARWRKAVEAVESQMQVHRRALARRGGSRTESPVVRTSRTVWDEISSATPLLLEGLTRGDVEVVDPFFQRQVDHSQGALFGATVTATSDGGSLDLLDPRRVDLARHVRTLGLTGPFVMPRDPATAQAVHHEVIALEATTRREIERRAGHLASMDLVDEITEHVMRTWVGHSISQVRRHLNDSTDVSVSGPNLFSTEGLVPRLPDHDGEGNDQI